MPIAKGWLFHMHPPPLLGFILPLTSNFVIARCGLAGGILPWQGMGWWQPSPGHHRHLQGLAQGGSSKGNRVLEGDETCISQTPLLHWSVHGCAQGRAGGKMLRRPPREAAGAVDRMKFQLIP